MKLGDRVVLESKLGQGRLAIHPDVEALGLVVGANGQPREAVAWKFGGCDEFAAAVAVVLPYEVLSRIMLKMKSVFLLEIVFPQRKTHSG